MSDAIALIAVCVSALTWWRSNRFEERMRSESAARAKFDITFGNPLTTRLELLEGVIADFKHAIYTTSNVSNISSAMSAVQLHQHTEWYFGIDSFLLSQNQASCKKLQTALNEYWDNSGFLINEISNSISAEQAKSNLRELGKLGDKFLAIVREIIIDNRNNIF